MILIIKDKSLLRNHPFPTIEKLNNFLNFCKSIGFQDLEINSSSDLKKFFKILKKKCSSLEYQTLVILGAKIMRLAKYFSTENLEKEQWHHFALNVDEYTHFTSPIRRYADIIVHRILHNCIIQESDYKKEKLLEQIPQSLIDICNHCNDKKFCATKVQEQSNELYFYLFLKKKGFLILDAVIIDITQTYLIIIIPLLSLEEVIYFQDLPIIYKKLDGKNVTLYWSKENHSQLIQASQTFHILSICQVKVMMKKKSYPFDINIQLILKKAT